MLPKPGELKQHVDAYLDVYLESKSADFIP